MRFNKHFVLKNTFNYFQPRILNKKQGKEEEDERKKEVEEDEDKIFVFMPKRRQAPKR